MPITAPCGFCGSAPRPARAPGWGASFGPADDLRFRRVRDGHAGGARSVRRRALRDRALARRSTRRRRGRPDRRDRGADRADAAEARRRGGRRRAGLRRGADRLVRGRDGQGFSRKQARRRRACPLRRELGGRHRPPRLRPGLLPDRAAAPRNARPARRDAERRLERLVLASRSPTNVSSRRLRCRSSSTSGRRFASS